MAIITKIERKFYDWRRNNPGRRPSGLVINVFDLLKVSEENPAATGYEIPPSRIIDLRQPFDAELFGVKVIRTYDIAVGEYKFIH